MDFGPRRSLLLFVRALLISTAVDAVNLEGELFKDLMNGYNKDVRPMKKSGNITQVFVKMTLTNLISLNEKEEALMTSVWIEMEWCDYRLRWDQPPRSALYGNITSKLRVPSKKIWLPDIILENNVDGQFEIAYYCNALVSPNGCVYWLPPAIYRSACPITVYYFPFDWQNCSMVFRSQTYSANEIELVLQKNDNHTLEWVEIDPEAFTAGGQKCTMSIVNLLGQTVFLCLIAKKVPETSKAVPLIEKYLMFVMSVTTTVVMNCVVVLNVSLRTPSTHVMSDNVRKIFLNVLPQLLRMGMKRWTPYSDKRSFIGNDELVSPDGVPCRRRSSVALITKAEEYSVKVARSELLFDRLKERNGLMKSVLEKLHDGLREGTTERLSFSLAQASAGLKQCVASCKHIAETRRQQSNFQSENEEWFLVARVIDRVCFIVMALVFFIGTIGIFLMGHFNQPPSLPFPGDPYQYLPPSENNTVVDERRGGADFLG
ncbi:acetylcholine receptor subunit gamma isoform X2 [Austrofundulus limnaeus]|uniref:Acetylcholine receptor subunit gamma isoform X2 n=1 Tax=Austrofundulus limnaeus TaxID=52670 RepID=A0A2I4CB30_AUSLI|nr:PREDICTED: acetylcholine receptor subunit gamma-like isoform X2 [Austrofundulus limnaeus]